MSTRKPQATPPGYLYVSRETVRKLFKQLDQYELVNRRWGRRAANRTRKHSGAGVLVHRPLERTEIDHFHMDVHLIDDEGEPAGRPYLTVIIDCYSRMVLGYQISLSTPNAMSVLATIRHAVTIKPPVEVDRQALGVSLEKLPLEQGLNWEVAGLMSLVVMDNGGDFQSLTVRTGLDELGIEVQFCPPNEPWYKGIIERFGHTMNLRLIHWLPGTTYGKVMRDVEYDGRDHACLTLDELRQRVEATFMAYHRTPHKGKGMNKRTPLEVWREGVAQWPILLPPQDSLRFEAALSLTDERTLHKYGIDFDYEQFNSLELGDLWNRMPANSRVTIKLDPEDINYIYVIDPRNNEPFKVPNTRPRDERISWGLKKAIKNRGKALGVDHLDYEAELAKTLLQKVRKAPAKKTKGKGGKRAAPLPQHADVVPEVQTAPATSSRTFDPDDVFFAEAEA